MDRPEVFIPLILLAVLVVTMSVAVARRWVVARYGKAGMWRTYRRLRQVRTNRFKLTSKQRLRDALLRDEEVRAAILDHARDTGETLAQAEGRVETYLDEIIPSFDLVSYYGLGLPLAHAVVHALYKTEVWAEAVPDPKRLHRESAVVYIFNHRSNADFVFASLALKDRVQLSYAVGEWARVWPLEKLFKSFGSYFVRRGYKERLYHRVLRRYVQTITMQGVTQGIFLEGGLSRDGAFRPAKVGLLDALLQVAKEPGFERDLVFVPGAINYDRVLEDRALVAEARGSKPERSLWRMLRRTGRILFKNSMRLALRRVRKHGHLALRLGEPVSLRAYVAEHGDAALDPDRERRSEAVQAFGDHLLGRVKELMPVCAVPLVCLALQRMELSALRDDLVTEVEALRRALEEAGARVVRGDRSDERVVRDAILLLEMRGTLYRDAAGILRVRPEDADLVRYYARSIEHLIPEGAALRAAHDLL